jgi:hypothetical protein
MNVKRPGTILLVPMFALATTACAQTTTYKTPEVSAPFYITFDAKGEPLVLDSDGNRLPLEGEGVDIRIPKPSTIKRVTNISALEIEGSHYYLLCLNGACTQIKLPDF